MDFRSQGYAGEISCEECGWTMTCPECGSFCRISQARRCAFLWKKIRNTHGCPSCMRDFWWKRPGIEALYEIARALLETQHQHVSGIRKKRQKLRLDVKRALNTAE